MCNLDKKRGNRRIDFCMRGYITFLVGLGLITRSCCCGHNKYKKTIIIETTNVKGIVTNYELLSGLIIPRKKRFYKKDKQGYYFIPEVENGKKN